MKDDFLVWKFEAFREYLSYEVLRNTAQVLSLYEGEDFNIRNNKIMQMQDLLSFRTNKDTWLPNRSGEIYINVNIEGDVYRNKGRLLTSMLLIYPKDLSDNKIRLTEFGKKLATGYISKKYFFDFIIGNYKYPHPAYAEDFDKWKEKGIVLLPFIIILQVLMKLKEKDINFLTTNEVAYFIYKTPNHKNVDKYMSEIIETRISDKILDVTSSDLITRKINDIFGFLVLSGYINQVGKGKFEINLERKKSIEDCIDSALMKYLGEHS